MPMTNDELENLLSQTENERLEFKEAKNKFSLEDLVKYCVAIANEGGGKLVLGVSDSLPERKVVGTTAFPNCGNCAARIFEKINKKVLIEEIDYENKRVLVFHIPSREVGAAWSDQGRFWMRAGDSLVPMSDGQLKSIHAEALSDFSAEIVKEASLHDLDVEAILEFRRRWADRDNNPKIESKNIEEVLIAADLMQNGKIAQAALILFGTKEAFLKYLPQAELIFEYRSSEKTLPAQDRIEFCQGFLVFHDKLWDKINLRNDRQSYQDGLFRVDIFTFDKDVVREAILNAICHRDYRLSSSIFVRQFARRLEIVSPGGFLPGISIENILDAQNPRNRRLAQALARCGLIERAGDGMNKMFELSIQHSKPVPDFSRTSNSQVFLTLDCNITNPDFLRFLEKVGKEKLTSFNTQDLLVLDYLQREQAVPEKLKNRLPILLQAGVVEFIGRGRGVRYFLSRKFYSAIGRAGHYTRYKGLDRESNKALILSHVRDSGLQGSPVSELEQVVLGLSRHQLKRIIHELRDVGEIKAQGSRRGTRWVKRDLDQL